ncbi:BamA/TamA family outer membrane protein [Carboxydochorda subterranea]|uniref:BamA/TamA family outer membrane protein n=1 Tax=Carboxydichorda subterranea TaxID=3109565 RepID=A0ABZ1BW72_9FIRM|nr:BamA/TamA family outer membrane protein [Limnochorda sp. L945t]WRP16913.1 BamA/TamA family outer membrane protein [Limnochorda sp. L945t]
MTARIRRTRAPVLRIAVAILAVTTVAAWAAVASAQAPPAQGAPPGQSPAQQQALPPAMVRAVVVSGNNEVPASQILDAITHTQPGKSLSREDIQADQRAILAMGYFRSVSVDVQSITLSSGTGPGEPVPVRVIFTVTENPVLRKVIVNAQPEVAPLLAKAGATPASLGALLELPTGKVAHGPTITRQLQDLPGKIWQRYGVLTSPGSVDLDDEGTLTVEVLPVRVGRIDVTGNNKTRPYVITRELSIKPGEVLQRADLEKSLRRVLMLQLFEEVNADLKGIPDKPDEVAVQVSVKERRTGNIQMGITWSQHEGPAGLLDVSDANFLGRAQQVGLAINYGANAQRYQVSFTEPYVDRSGTSLGFKLSWEQAKKPLDSNNPGGPQYWDRRYGGEVTLGRPLSEFTRGYLTFTQNKWEAPLVEGSGPSGIEEGTLRSVRLSTMTDTSNHPFNPSTGQRLRLSAEVAGLGGDFHFNKFEGSYSQYVPVQLFGTWQHVIAGRISLGDLISFDPQPPDQELFRLGGAESLRGYGYGTFSGTRMAMGNLEYRFPIYEMLSGVLFFDSGMAWKDGEQVDLRDLKWDAGLGLRIDIGALGMIRLDYGMTRESSGQFHFSIGQQF